MSTPEQDKALQDMLRELDITPAPDGFTDRVMEHVQMAPAPKPIQYKAPIGRWGWVAIAAAFISLCVAGLGSNYEFPAVMPEVHIGEFLPTLPFADVSPAIPLALIALSAILVLERMLSKNRLVR